MLNLIWDLIDKIFPAPCSVYLGIPMTGYDQHQMVEVSKAALEICKKYGLVGWSPVLHEHVPDKKIKLKADHSLDWKWPMDKDALNNCFAFANLRADEKSFGCEDEYGRHRYSEWQPCVRVSPKHSKGYWSIANYQTDYLAPDWEDGARALSEKFGKRSQRIQWKLGIWKRSYLKWHWRQISRLFQ